MKKRLLISIANYGDSQLDYLEKVIDNFETYSHEVELVIDTTVNLSNIIERKKLPISQRLFDPSVACTLPFKHREYFAKNIDRYDYFLYLENDLYIPQTAIDFVIDETANLEKDEIIGFFRFENDHGIQYITDHDISCPLSKYHAWKNNGHMFFAPFILHSGCYLVSKDQLKHAIASGGFLARPHTGPYGMLEQGASDIYTQCGFKSKFLPVPIAPVLIHHMPDKYVQMPTAAPRFSVDALSVLETKLGNKPKLKPLLQPNMVFRLYQELRYELNLVERKIRHRLRGKR
jgi:hypothetical protein